MWRWCDFAVAVERRRRARAAPASDQRDQRYDQCGDQQPPAGARQRGGHRQPHARSETVRPTPCISNDIKRYSQRKNSVSPDLLKITFPQIIVLDFLCNQNVFG